MTVLAVQPCANSLFLDKKLIFSSLSVNRTIALGDGLPSGNFNQCRSDGRPFLVSASSSRFRTRFLASDAQILSKIYFYYLEA